MTGPTEGWGAPPSTVREGRPPGWVAEMFGTLKRSGLIQPLGGVLRG